jgi:two-component system, NtrC family, nitrogen regulation sensor histidine kinase NtrY
MKKILKKYRLPVLLTIMSLITCIITVVVYGYVRYTNSPVRHIEAFNSTLNERYELSESLLKKISSPAKIQGFQELYSSSKTLPRNISLFVIQYDSLIFWSDNSIPFNIRDTTNRIVRTDNGFYQLNKINHNGYTYVLLDLIKHKYPYQNDYLISSYNQTYALNPDYKISLTNGYYPVTAVGGEELFYITPITVHKLSGDQEFVLYSLTMLILIFLVFALYYYSVNSGMSKMSSVTTIVLALLGSRAVLFLTDIPFFFKEFDLFSPLNYASSYLLPSLGDLLTNVLFFTILSFIIFRSFKNYTLVASNKIVSAFYVLVSLALITLFYYLSLYLIDTLIINSSFELNLSKILDFSVYSLIGYFIIALILLSLFYVTYILTRVAVQIMGITIFMLIFVLFSVGIWFIFVSAGLYIPQWEELVLFILYISLVTAIVSGILPFPHISSTTLLVVMLTFISTFCLYHNKVTKENEERKLMALRLSSDQDKIAEYLYAELERSIVSDTMLYNVFMASWYNPKTEDKCIEYLHDKYFTGYWSKYNAQITLCYPGKQLAIKPSDIIVECNTYFDNIISNITDKTLNKTLFYVRESYGASSYIAKIPVHNSAFKGESGSIVIEFTQKYVPKGLGYPELLLDKSFASFYDMSLYSYAIYSNGELIKNVGDYSYSISEKPFETFKGEYRFFDKNGYNHLFHSVRSDTSIIISKKNQSLFDKLTPFTYQLIFHIILIFLLTTAFNLRVHQKRYPDLKAQLQIMLVALVLFASMLIGATTIHNIRSLNEEKNRDMLSEKAHSVLIEIEHKLDDVESIESLQEPYLQELLTKFSLVFFSDINLYTTKGDLLATSRPEIFQEGLRSDLMSPDAFKEIAVGQRTFYVTTEQIGSYKYLSAYIPFRNKQNELIAYINLPYFAREHELRQEISSFLVTFVNIYIILTAIAVIISLLVGNYVTRPLQLIRDQFSNVMLDKKNEKITYHREDELGNLINEYNLMIEKLADSVDKLAQTERETAWKEMARQIAHEIKNPLTPMKLSIQHLYRSYQDNSPDWESRLEKTTTSIIQQIDSLAAIASAFSDFAKFPLPSPDKVELNELIKDTVALFVPQSEFNITFKHPDHPCFVYTDKKQLSRVMVNLLNNAVQSIPVDRKGKINISVNTVGKEHHIFISDNGIGIPDELKPRIFSPNFTTKSAGAGLGLAMVKNIINSANGSITFTSHENGTTFEIHLPAIETDSTTEN